MAAIAAEKYIDEPTKPRYKSGGWIAKAGSCKIGFNPKPSVRTGKILEKVEKIENLSPGKNIEIYKRPS